MNNLTVVKFSALRDFLAVVERGSVHAAARHQGGAQPTVSRNIRELERRLGVVLFERSAKGTQLTAMGKVFYARAKAAQAELVRAQEELDQLRGQTHGNVTVGLSTVAQFALLPDAVGPFREKYPGVRLNVLDALFPRIESDLRNGTIDCYVGPVPETLGPDFRVEKLFENTRVIVARKGHPLARARSLRELVKAEWATTPLTPKADAELAPVFEHYKLPTPRSAMQLHSPLTTLVMIAKTDLLVLLPIQWVGSQLWTDDVQTIPVKEVLPGPAIGIISRSALPLTPAAEYFTDMIRRVAGPLGKSTKSSGSRAIRKR
ncbi:MAG: LysR family transcriptional regulator [Pseudomonadota bacterium]|nr:LysR family transcriptional regulator [Pseudomonadota bacterium]